MLAVSVHVLRALADAGALTLPTTNERTPMKPVIDALQEIVNDIDTYGLNSYDKLVASVLLSTIIFTLERSHPSEQDCKTS